MKLFWIDLETTGLSPERDKILELAVAETDLERPFDIGPVRAWVHQGVPCRPDGSAAMSDFVLTMHTKSGLLAECARSTTTVAEVEDHLLSIVPEVADREDKPVLAGSSVHFDLGFLRAQMPRLAARLSHRLYDVSAVKLFCQSLGMPRAPKAEAHRAKDDILESIEHAKVCAEWLEGWGRIANGEVPPGVRERWVAHWLKRLQPDAHCVTTPDVQRWCSCSPSGRNTACHLHGDDLP